MFTRSSLCWEASTEQVLIDHIKLKLKEIDVSFRVAYERCQRKIRTIADDGVFSNKK